MESDIHTRIDQLERRLRRQHALTIISLLLAALSVAWVWTSQPRARSSALGTTVEAQRFVLKDAKGDQRGVWEVSAANIPSFQIGQPGFPRVLLYESTVGPGMSLLGGSPIYLSSASDSAYLYLRGPNKGAPIDAALQSSPEAQSKWDGDACRLGTSPNQLILKSSTGQVAMDAGHTNNYGPWLDMTKDQKVRLSLGKGFNTGNHWRLTFKNRDASIISETPATPPPD